MHWHIYRFTALGCKDEMVVMQIWQIEHFIKEDTQEPWDTLVFTIVRCRMPECLVIK